MKTYFSSSEGPLSGRNLESYKESWTAKCFQKSSLCWIAYFALHVTCLSMTDDGHGHVCTDTVACSFTTFWGESSIAVTDFMICPFFRMHFKSENCLAKGFRGHNLIWDQTNLHDSIGSTCPRGPVPKGSITTTTVNQKNPKYSSLHLQPGLLTCIESHDFVSFSQLDHNSDYGLALWSSALHATSAADLWMQGSLLASMQTCTPPPMPGTECHNHKISIFKKVQLITSAARCTDLHRVPWSFHILTAKVPLVWRCICMQHLMRICGCKAHCSLQCRPLNPLPCPVQHVTINKKLSFEKYRSSHLQPGALTCIESHDYVSFSHLDCNSATGLALYLHATSDADLWMQGSLLAIMQTFTPPAMPGTACHNHKILIF